MTNSTCTICNESIKVCKHTDEERKRHECDLAWKVHEEELPDESTHLSSVEVRGVDGGAQEA